jgi:hypothetical protein
VVSRTPEQRKVLKSAYVRIMLNSHRGLGVRLTPQEVIDASFDSAIETSAQCDLERVGLKITHDGKIEPFK